MDPPQAAQPHNEISSVARAHKERYFNNTLSRSLALAVHSIYARLYTHTKTHSYNKLSPAASTKHPVLKGKF